MFPKIRSWIALGAPLELLSPLSVARILFTLAVVALPLLALSAADLRVLPMIVVFASGFVLVLGLLRARDLSQRDCHLLAILASTGSATGVWALHGVELAVGPILFLGAVGVFLALFVRPRHVLIHQTLAALEVAFAISVDRGVRLGAVVAIAAIVPTLTSSLTVSMLTGAARRRGTTDPDTGLPNGFGLQDLVDRRPDEKLVVATVALRGLREAREALGYQAGTELLRRAVEDLGQVLPAGATIARVDGDDLVVVEPVGRHTDAAVAATQLAMTLISGIGAGRHMVGEIEVVLGAHVGLAIAPHDGDDLTELVRRATITARRTMSSGRQHSRWDGSDGSLTSDDLALLADLRLAIDKGELWLAYQPKVAPATGRTTAVEALLRWDSPRHGKVAPGDFIPLAERTGLIDRLTEWVLANALDAQVRWRASGVDLPVSINISPLSLSDPRLPIQILSALHARRLPAACLAVEVTETATFDIVQAVDRLRPLHDEGVRVSIDDFGTGYTSLSVLPHLPLDELKVDQRFVRASLHSHADEAIVQSVRELAHRLGLAAVAEGVETEELSDHMTKMGFDLLQGFHYAKPLAERDLLAFVRRSGITSGRH
jgi:predicted signal transduction protein with EAL and GGDEF domain